MAGQLLDGKNLANSLLEKLKDEIEGLKKTTGHVPHLINIMIGKDPSSCAYANSQKKVAEKIGINYELVTLPNNISQHELQEYIHRLNDDSSINGIMLHKPVPSSIDYNAASSQINVAKDMEGVNVTNIGKMLVGDTQIIPCTPAAVMEHVLSTSINLRGKEVVIVGHSEIVGKPLSLLMLKEEATVTVCHVATSEAGTLTDHVGRADILIVAVGKPNLVKGEWIKPGAIVVDVGINKVGDKIVGDVEFEEAQKRASYITPVPGGVGPVTVVMLMKNGIEAYKAQKQLI